MYVTRLPFLSTMVHKRHRFEPSRGQWRVFSFGHKRQIVLFVKHKTKNITFMQSTFNGVRSITFHTENTHYTNDGTTRKKTLPSSAPSAVSIRLGEGPNNPSPPSHLGVSHHPPFTFGVSHSSDPWITLPSVAPPPL